MIKSANWIKNWAKNFRAHFYIYIWQNRLSRILFLISALFVCLHFVLLFLPGWKLRETGESMALRYNVYYGVDLVGSWGKLFLYPLLALLIFCINFGIVLFLIKRDRLFGHYFLGITTAMLLLNFLTLISVLALNLNFMQT